MSTFSTIVHCTMHTLATCTLQGDRGTPLVCYLTPSLPTIRYLAGIGSWFVIAQGNCNINYPSVYTRIGAYLDWINANTP